MRTESLLLPGAVLIGCGLIGAGLYFGLRASAPGAVQGAPAPLLVSPPGLASGASPPAVAPAATAAGPGLDEVRRRVEQAAKDAIEAEKKTKYIPQCWEPLIRANPAPPTSKHFFSLGFDAEGRENVRGLNDIRGESRTDVSLCVQRIPMGIRITPPPGVPMNVDVPLEFP